MKYSDYQIISTLAETLNMRKAAEKLFISQPALSQRLQAIEEDWEEQIFLRSQKGLTMTPAGEKIIQYANDVLQAETKVKDELYALKSKVHGTLKLSVSSHIAQYWLPQVLKKFVQQYPFVKISLSTGWSSEVLHQMHVGDIHVGILRGNPDWHGEKLHLFTDSVYIVDNEIQTIEELSYTQKPFIQFKSDSSYYHEIHNWWRQRFQHDPRQTIMVDQIDTCKRLAINGIGYAILPAISLNDETADFHKIALTEHMEKPIERDIWLLYNPYQLQLRPVQAFIEIVKEFIKD